jgi:GNAT superfamily N-acetyltransferase
VIGSVELRDVDGGAGTICRSILDALPDWFGIPEANENYVSFADSNPSVIASVDRADVGITTVKLHSPYAAEVYLMAVRPSHHRIGVGTAMLRHVEANLAASGVEFLQVKTLSATRPDAGYDATRAFYLAYGSDRSRSSRRSGTRPTLPSSSSRRSRRVRQLDDQQEPQRGRCSVSRPGVTVTIQPPSPLSAVCHTPGGLIRA